MQGLSWYGIFSYALYTVSIPSSCGMFVYKPLSVTAIDTKIVTCETLVSSIKLMKSVVYLRLRSLFFSNGPQRMTSF